ncbi:Guanylate kinase [Candidatus Profftia lariciata]|uniref:guanylate kinase n=1 Tax=Candidatus Profftia lariciata TaxID=1987921 RepID=UPI001D00BF24|nr:guanylate kinase [Candidatus Profftia lariciata]UDG81355.1 Guanylate kinase [Candidatus Profftia lariciata]
MVLGMLYILSAPSGAGKTSLIQALLKNKMFYDLKVAISHTTRTKRPSENHAEHYYFISHDEFYQMIKKNAFIEYVKVFDDYYGTSYQSIEQIISKGMDVFLDIDWQGAQQIYKKKMQACSIFILPPSKEALNYRLLSRGQDSNATISKRMVHAVSEMMHYVEYDYLIVNNEFDIALLDLKTIICGERLRLNNQIIRHEQLIAALLTH